MKYIGTYVQIITAITFFQLLNTISFSFTSLRSFYSNLQMEHFPHFDSVANSHLFLFDEWKLTTEKNLAFFFHSNWQIGVHCIFKTVHFWFHWFLINNSETIYFLDTNRITRFCMITNFFGLKMGKVGNTAFENAAGATNQVVLYHLLPLNFRPNLRHFKDLSLPFSDKKEIFANHICSQWIFQP